MIGRIESFVVMGQMALFFLKWYSHKFISVWA